MKNRKETRRFEPGAFGIAFAERNAASETMVNPNQTVLIVARTPKIIAILSAWLTEAGVDRVVADSYPAARRHLDERAPAAILSEVRLAEYNGLQLAVHARGRGIPVGLIGAPDPVLQHEAEELGATYFPERLEPQGIFSVLAPVIEAARLAFPWRSPGADVAASAGGEQAGESTTRADTIPVRRRVLRF
jgi:DNA-binding NtrC family response regulator